LQTPKTQTTPKRENKQGKILLKSVNTLLPVGSSEAYSPLM
jgi:hypothetical protein